MAIEYAPPTGFAYDGWLPQEPRHPSMEDLIAPGMSTSARPVRGLVAGAFVATLVCTGAAEVFFAPEPLQLVGQERRDQVAASSETNVWDGSLARAVETDFRLRGRVRRWLAPYWAAAMLKLGDTPNRDVIVGDDGWLFLRERVFLDPEGKRTGHEHLANLFGLVRRSLGARGIELICVPLPRKAAVCSERLPHGIDPDMGYDGLVVGALRRRGVTTVDVAERWNALSPDECYLPLDSHWALPARLAFARALLEEVPGLPSGQMRFEYAAVEEDLFQSSLRFAGVDRGHPANAFFNVVPSPKLRLMPPGVEERIDAHEIPSSILHVGTSFSALFNVRALLCRTLAAPVEDASEPGQMPLLSLQRTLAMRPGDAIPPFVISEFPIHQASMMDRHSKGTVRAALGMARQLNFLGRARTTLDELIAPAQIGAPLVGRPLIHFPAGSILSSGDGVVGIRLEFDGPENSRWDFETSGAAVEIGANRGARSRAFPIVEGGDADFHVLLRPRNEASLGTEVTAHVVTDADLEHGRVVRGDDVSAGRWIAAPELPVAPLDALAVTWEKGVSGPVQLLAYGTSAGGQPVDARWNFPVARDARVLVVTLGPFEGGSLERLELTGASKGARAVLAGQIRAE